MRRAPRNRPAASQASWLGGLLLAVPALSVVGFFGVLLFSRLEVATGVGPGLLVVAVGAGVVSFFSPCSFPLLVSILGQPVHADGRRESARTTLAFAAALSGGAAIFLLAFGAVIALVGAALFDGLTFDSTGGRALRIVVGALLVLLGLIQLNRLPVSFRRFEPATHRFLRHQSRLRRRRPVAGFILFGFGYLAAGFG